jgi:hypothetical protein
LALCLVRFFEAKDSLQLSNAKERIVVVISTVIFQGLNMARILFSNYDNIDYAMFRPFGIVNKTVSHRNSLLKEYQEGDFFPHLEAIL